MQKSRFWVLAVIVFSAAFSRLIPHPYNFTPITGMALFGGAYFSDKKSAFLVPLSAMVISDLFLGYHSLLPLVYLYLALTVLIGIWLGKERSAWVIAGTTLSCSILFFVVTNFAVWLFDGLYPHTALGLAQCFAAAVPFFHYTVLGDAFYTVLLFGGFVLAEKRFSILQTQSHPRNL